MEDIVYAYFCMFSPNSTSSISEEANSNDRSNFSETFMKNLQNIFAPILVIGFILSAISSTPHEEKQVNSVPLCKFLNNL